jgi:hypothetical protein
MSTSTITPPYLAASSSTINQAFNPNHALWVAQDQMNHSVLISLISEPLLPPIISFDTSHEVWHTLEKMFASQSKASVMHTWLQLTTLKKGSLSVQDYFNKVKRFADILVAIG